MVGTEGVEPSAIRLKVECSTTELRARTGGLLAGFAHQSNGVLVASAMHQPSQPPHDQPPYHSAYGGLWIDRPDWPQTLAARLAAGAITPACAALVEGFVRDGFVILNNAARPGAVDAFQAQINHAFREGRPDVLYQHHGSTHNHALTKPVNRLGTRVVDSFVPLPQALDLFASPALLSFLSAIFAAPPLLFQSLSFDQGSQQGLHQDTAYVVVDHPLELAACWIALQDVQPGSGELIYVPGSHRFPDFAFGGAKKHWLATTDGDAVHVAWSRWIHDEAAQRGLSVRHFLPHKGDILIWHADLAHGGAAVENPNLTRQSLVGHFCPATRRPRYFDHGAKRDTTREANGLFYASEHYNLAKRRRLVRVLDRLRGK